MLVGNCNLFVLGFYFVLVLICVVKLVWRFEAHVLVRSKASSPIIAFARVNVYCVASEWLTEELPKIMYRLREDRQRSQRLGFVRCVWRVNIQMSINQAWCFYFSVPHLGCKFTWEFPFQVCPVTIMGLERLYKQNVPGKHPSNSVSKFLPSVQWWSCFPGVLLLKYLLWRINTELHQSAHHDITYHTIMWNLMRSEK